MAKNPPVDVQQYGQSIWYDNISRQLLDNGEIQRLVDEDGVMGMTSNPTIFEQAIARSEIYDASISETLDADVNEIFEHLAIADIRAAADILRPIYDRTGGADGFISLEVPPTIANDTETTIREAARLRDAVDRPNLMIKIPATDAGIPAIEESIYNGVNINVTLIFSNEYYAKVIEAYLRGLERRVAAGLSIDSIASVASFFLSRIDVMVDQQLESNILRAQGRDIDRVAANRRLLGKAAIANAKLAYKVFKDHFNSERFETLRKAGANVQRPLWASTGTKNPAYSDTMYVDSLIGPDTVNTVPPATLVAFKDHGTVAPTLEEGLDEATEVLDMLAEVGVSLDMVTKSLLEDGVEKFLTSFQNLMSVIEGKRKMLKAGVMARQTAVLGAYRQGVEETVEELKDAPSQIWGRSAEWWREELHHRESIINRLGWLDVLDGRIDHARLQALQESAKAFEYVVLLGMGGSSLAPEVLSLTFGQQAGFPELLMLDSTVPAAVKAIDDAIDYSKTVFVVASKSGTTIETQSFYDYFYAQAVDKFGAQEAGKHFIIITDPGSIMIDNGKERHVRDIFENPSDIGGRYSALSYFGLVPAALLGLDLQRLIESAARMRMAIDEEVPYKSNPALQLGAMMGHIGKAGRDKLAILTSSQLSSFGNWVEQLVAESTGKLGVGIVPVVGTTFGMPHDYDDDRFLVYIRLDDDPNLAHTDSNIQMLREAGHPVVTIHLKDAYEIGGEFLRWEFATAVAGKVLNINPFDEPDVSSAKAITKTFLNQYIESGSLPAEAPMLTQAGVSLYADAHSGAVLQDITDQRNFDTTGSGADLEALLAAHISLAGSGKYIGFLVYSQMTSEIDDKLQTIRRRVRHTTKRAVTIGYGPRYLHSTGQLHKGGDNLGVFILITVDDEQDVAIPDKPYSFSVLKQAQQLGDLQALRNAKRSVVRLHITGDILAGLDKISQAIEAAEAKII